MYRKTLIAISALALIAAVPTLAIAKSIKNLVTPASLADYCAKVGVGTENEVTITLPDGSTATGSIHCEDEDLVVGGDDDGEDDEIDSPDGGEDDEVDSPDEGDDDELDDDSEDDGDDSEDDADDSEDDGDDSEDDGDSGDDGDDSEDD
jgi:hypothetical protein